MYVSVLAGSCLRFKRFFIYIPLMCYCEFVNVFIIMSLKICESVNRLKTYILNLIKQTINNVMHNTIVKWYFDV